MVDIVTKDITSIISNEYCTVDTETFSAVLESGWNFLVRRISGLDGIKIAADVLNAAKAVDQAELVARYCDLRGKKVLEIGSGFGVNHIVWTKKYGIDGYGLEPDAEGFESSFKISRQLVRKNGLDDARIIDAPGEKIPFPEGEFEVIYSANVLEHCQDPGLVLDEALRVLKPGGVMQFVYPNYHSFFEGHYAVFHPPVLWKDILVLYLEWICRRDTDFAKTLRTELNAVWTTRKLGLLKKKYDFKVISLGEDIFAERMAGAGFGGWAGLGRVRKAVEAARMLGLNRLAAAIILKLRAWTPLIVTLRKK